MEAGDDACPRESVMERLPARVDVDLEATVPFEVMHFAPAVAARALDRADERRALERERVEVTAGILAVAGGATFVEICNLRRPALVVEALRSLAAGLAVELTLIARAEGVGSDVLVRARRP